MLYYIYPTKKNVSFSIVARHHLRYLKRLTPVYEIDEEEIPRRFFVMRPVVFVHPYFYPAEKFEDYMSKLATQSKALIGIDVADSDALSKDAVFRWGRFASAFVVPSNFSRLAYINSGFKQPVFVVPHGLEPEWYVSPPLRRFEELWKLKEQGYKLFLFFLMHSDYRKGWDLVQEFWKKLGRRDAKLVLKCGLCNDSHVKWAEETGNIYLGQWFSEEELMGLYDAADIYLLFSRGGGFEINGLEALVRGNVVIASAGGSWEEYLPPWSLVQPRARPIVMPGNHIHVGRGVEIDVDKAVDLAHTVLENLEEYKAKVREYVAKHVAPYYTWEHAAKQLYEIYLQFKY